MPHVARERESESGEGVMANMQIEEGSPSERAFSVATPSQPSEREKEGVLHLSPSSVWSLWTRRGKEWINKFVDFGQSGKTGEMEIA